MLIVENLNIETVEQKKLIKNINFNINKGEFVALVGESGSGKSLTAMSIAQLLSDNLKTSGNIYWYKENVLHYSSEEKRVFRRDKISFVFQNPMHCLNPSITCGEQINEVFKQFNQSKSQIVLNTKKVLKQVDLLDAERVMESYPHQLSGGQKQRVMIAIALASNAELLIADEPTTALDVIVQKEILDLIKNLQKQIQLSVLFITHDLNVAFRYADTIVVMKDGNIVEKGDVDTIQYSPEHIYTKALMQCRPTENYRRPLPTVEQFSSNIILPSKNKPTHSKSESILDINKLYFSYGDKQVLKNLNFSLFNGESVGIVGASGSGKSTLGKCIMRLEENFKGSIQLLNKEILEYPIKEYRKIVQMVFQDPYGSLDARPKVASQLTELYRIYQPENTKSKNRELQIELLQKVGLDESYLQKRPKELSGGQRQRICIARTLITGAKIIILDESIAALDVSVQATILNLLNDLREEFGLTYLFISHDLASVQYFCDRILVLKDGEIVDFKSSDTLLDSSSNSYTKELWEASVGDNQKQTN